MPGCGECVDELAADLIAARTDVRPHCHDEILGTCPKLAAHRIDSGDGYTRDRAAPPGMHSSHDAARAICHQERNAVRSAHRNRHVDRIRDERISFRARVRHGRSAAKDDDLSAMHLVDHRHVVRADGLGEITHVVGGRQLQLPRRKQMRRDCGKRTTAECRAPGLIGPLETVRDLRQARVGSN